MLARNAVKPFITSLVFGRVVFGVGTYAAGAISATVLAGQVMQGVLANSQFLTKSITSTVLTPYLQMSVHFNTIVKTIVNKESSALKSKRVNTMNNYRCITISKGKYVYHGSTIDFDMPRPSSFFAICPGWSWTYVSETRGIKDVHLMKFQTTRELVLLDLVSPLYNGDNAKLRIACEKGEEAIISECKRRGIDGWVSNDHVSAKGDIKYEICLLDPNSSVQKHSLEITDSIPFQLDGFSQLRYLESREKVFARDETSEEASFTIFTISRECFCRFGSRTK